jgi:hypothetical protein
MELKSRKDVFLGDFSERPGTKLKVLTKAFFSV